MNGYRLMVWVGRDGIIFVSCFSVSIIVSGLSNAAHSLRCLLGGWCVFGFLFRFAPLCEDKKEEFCVSYCGCGLISVQVYRGLREVLTCERMLTLSCFWRCLQVCISGGIFLGTSVLAPVFAAGLFHLSKYTLYVFLSCCFVWRGILITMSAHLFCKLTFTVCIKHGLRKG